MRPKNFHIDVVGLMSGTSLDGLDLCCVHFDYDGAWRYRIVKAESVDYPAELREKLATAQSMSALDYARLHSDYGLYLGEQVRDFVARNGLKVDLVASHGQTIFHQPGAISYDVTQIITEAGTIVITSSDGDMEYNGTAQSYAVYTVTYNGVELTPGKGVTYTIPGTGDALEITCISSLTHVSDGPITNDYTYTLEHSSSYHAVITNKGNIQVTPRAVTVTSADDSKTYDEDECFRH